MKYIRTKDGRIFETNGHSYWNNYILYSELYPKGLENFKKTIIKQADTIEELCDVFALFDDKSPYTIYTSYDEAQRIRENRIVYYNDKRNMIIYGAIWTDKGLIYVSKMNEKGELELL